MTQHVIRLLAFVAILYAFMALLGVDLGTLEMHDASEDVKWIVLAWPFAACLAFGLMEGIWFCGLCAFLLYLWMTIPALICGTLFLVASVVLLVGGGVASAKYGGVRWLCFYAYVAFLGLIDAIKYGPQGMERLVWVVQCQLGIHLGLGALGLVLYVVVGVCYAFAFGLMTSVPGRAVQQFLGTLLKVLYQFGKATVTLLWTCLLAFVLCCHFILFAWSRFPDSLPWNQPVARPSTSSDIHVDNDSDDEDDDDSHQPPPTGMSRSLTFTDKHLDYASDTEDDDWDKDFDFDSTDDTTTDESSDDDQGYRKNRQMNSLGCSTYGLPDDFYDYSDDDSSAADPSSPMKSPEPIISDIVSVCHTPEGAELQLDTDSDDSASEMDWTPCPVRFKSPEQPASINTAASPLPTAHAVDSTAMAEDSVVDMMDVDEPSRASLDLVVSTPDRRPLTSRLADMVAQNFTEIEEAAPTTFAEWRNMTQKRVYTQEGFMAASTVPAPSPVLALPPVTPVTTMPATTDVAMSLDPTEFIDVQEVEMALDEPDRELALVPAAQDIPLPMETDLEYAELNGSDAMEVEPVAVNPVTIQPLLAEPEVMQTSEEMSCDDWDGFEEDFEEAWDEHFAEQQQNASCDQFVFAGAVPQQRVAPASMSFFGANATNTNEVQVDFSFGPRQTSAAPVSWFGTTDTRSATTAVANTVVDWNFGSQPAVGQRNETMAEEGQSAATDVANFDFDFGSHQQAAPLAFFGGDVTERAASNIANVDFVFGSQQPAAPVALFSANATESVDNNAVANVVDSGFRPQPTTAPMAFFGPNATQSAAAELPIVDFGFGSQQPAAPVTWFGANATQPAATAVANIDFGFGAIGSADASSSAVVPAGLGSVVSWAQPVPTTAFVFGSEQQQEVMMDEDCGDAAEEESIPSVEDPSEEEGSFEPGSLEEFLLGNDSLFGDDDDDDGSAPGPVSAMEEDDHDSLASLFGDGGDSDSLPKESSAPTAADTVMDAAPEDNGASCSTGFGDQNVSREDEVDYSMSDDEQSSQQQSSQHPAPLAPQTPYVGPGLQEPTRRSRYAPDAMDREKPTSHEALRTAGFLVEKGTPSPTPTRTTGARQLQRLTPTSKKVKILLKKPSKPE
ncbi:hypothetical protein PFICI_13320 [Pestalotiopsis fici W106-1]|uniref:Uncharacterized protein n=1 Tax=Pestalotiopsis fici (strain W106-1 / CGMCC3.15140) TaxID=1229662 RepID=W3WPU3_PESFW|nr:uncharacterized protein PFICI_13320 [Pestalotiopsis fici W106-1]ETS74836.1 hypothetical protein PFICI_13320 [Pestalotiopsis fici W106-1]